MVPVARLITFLVTTAGGVLLNTMPAVALLGVEVGMARTW